MGDAPSGPIRHQGKLSGSDVYLSDSGSIGGGSRCLFSGLEQVDSGVSFPSGSYDFEGFSSSGDLQRTSSVCNPGLTEPDLVSSDSVQGQVLSGSGEPIPVSIGGHDTFLQHLKSVPPLTLLEFMKMVYSNLYSSESSEILVQCVRVSTGRQYQSVWSNFCSFIRSKNILVISTESGLSYLRYLFKEKNLSPNTVATYKAALGKPLKMAFGIDVGGSPFPEFIKALHNIKPSVPVTRIMWSIDKVLNLALMDEYMVNPSIVNSLSVTAFSLSLATGSRVSELHAVMRGKEFLEFSDLGVKLFPNPAFLAKNEAPNSRRPPIFISRLRQEGTRPHPLCPVRNLEVYIELTKQTNSCKLFVNPVSLMDLSLHKLRWFLCKFIRKANPHVFPKTHDLRKYASSYAFFNCMNMQEVCNLVGWSSIRVFRKHYLKEIDAISSSFMCLGREIHPN